MRKINSVVKCFIFGSLKTIHENFESKKLIIGKYTITVFVIYESLLV